MNDLIAVSEARELIRQKVEPLAPQSCSLDDAAGHITSEEIYSPLNIPSYPQSSMDGYAISLEGWNKYGSLPIRKLIQAGTREQVRIEAGEAARIFTGAAVPEGADTVVMQEQAIVKDNLLVGIDPIPEEAGANVRAIGSEILQGQIALRPSSLLTPGAIGFLAGMGIEQVKIIRKPAVGIIMTGNEIIGLGETLSYGMVYDSNSHTLKAALQQLDITKIRMYHSRDSREQLEATLIKAVEENDMVLLTGGVSVGDYDLVIQAARGAGVEKVFHKVRQKPGKPLFFGMKQNKPLFGLPGNPASVLTCFYEYVTVAISQLTGQLRIPVSTQAVLNGSYSKAKGLTHFLKGVFEDGKVQLPEGQESYKMNSFAIANCLVVIPEDQLRVNEGDSVEIHHLTF